MKYYEIITVESEPKSLNSYFTIKIIKLKSKLLKLKSLKQKPLELLLVKLLKLINKLKLLKSKKFNAKKEEKMISFAIIRIFCKF